MRVSIYKMDDGLRTVIVEKTQRDENPTRIVSNVKRADLSQTLGAAIREVAPDIQEEQIPLPSP